MQVENFELKLLAQKLVDQMHKLHSADLAQKWEGATIRFIPKDPSLNEHDMSIDAIMHKVVMIRDNLRVLEQQINSNSNLSDGEKLKLQSYITRSYGSLTSFNFMFYNEEDKFSSKK